MLYIGVTLMLHALARYNSALQQRVKKKGAFHEMA